MADNNGSNHDGATKPESGFYQIQHEQSGPDKINTSIQDKEKDQKQKKHVLNSPKPTITLTEPELYSCQSISPPHSQIKVAVNVPDKEEMEKNPPTTNITVTTSKESYLCDVCDEVFSSSNDLSSHWKEHAGKEPYICDVCGKTCYEPSALASHKISHSSERLYSCDICGKTFKHKSNRNRHILIHSGNKPFVCNMCGKGFTYENYLTVHKRIHSGDKPFVCEVCGKDFTDKATMYRHRKIHQHRVPLR